MGWGEGQMLEIDDRYPEYARPYEPIKGRHILNTRDPMNRSRADTGTDR